MPPDVRSEPTAGHPREAGYSLLELVVAMGIMTVVTGAIFQMVGSGQNAFKSQPEVSDMQQRLRVAADMIYMDLVTAGAGTYIGANAGPLSNYLPPIRPARRGDLTPDGDLTFANDRITLAHVPRTVSQTTVQTTMGAPNDPIQIDTTAPGCPATAACGFADGARAVIFDTSLLGAGYDFFTVASTSATTLLHGGLSQSYSASDSRVTEVVQHVYYYDSSTDELRYYDGYQTDVALVDNVVGLTFRYYANPDPNSAPPPPTGLGNCVYAAGDPPTPLLPNLGGETLVELTAGDLTDGPFCGSAPNRFDGDLLRVQKVGVTIRVQAANAQLRGTDTQRFVRAGTATGGQAYVPDYAVHFEVSPRNMNLIR